MEKEIKQMESAVEQMGKWVDFLKELDKTVDPESAMNLDLHLSDLSARMNDYITFHVDEVKKGKTSDITVNVMVHGVCIIIVKAENQDKCFWLYEYIVRIIASKISMAFEKPQEYVIK